MIIMMMMMMMIMRLRMLFMIKICFTSNLPLKSASSAVECDYPAVRRCDVQIAKIRTESRSRPHQTTNAIAPNNSMCGNRETVHKTVVGSDH